jgi:predicted RNA-binding Zn-ribbon protein involved in translation (DUF1610 family)
MTNSISCPVCNNLCSSQALSCPKCGHPFIHEAVSKNTQEINSEFTCPKCGSDQTSTLKMAYSQGTSSGKISAGTITADGNLALTGGKVNSQSVLAKQVAPPRKPLIEPIPILILLISSLIIGFILAGSVYEVIAVYVFFITFLVLLGGGGYFYYSSVQKQMPEYLKKMEDWKKSKICFRCGNKWITAFNENSAKSIFNQM